MRLWALAAAALALSAGAAQACGPRSDCVLLDASGAALGVYRIREPAAAPPPLAGGRPALLFIHGYRSSAGAVVSHDGLQAFADEIGAALVAPDGLGDTWSYPGSPSQRRDEFAYFDALRRDLIARRGVDPERILVSGFSMGASMAWYLACRRGDHYPAVVTFAGAFWEPLPDRCERPPRALLHVHGTADRTVPIEGRAIRSWRQGDAWRSFDALMRGLGPWDAQQAVSDDGMACRLWRAKDRLFRFCRHEGGHIWRAAWLRSAWRTLSGRDEN